MTWNKLYQLTGINEVVWRKSTGWRSSGMTNNMSLSDILECCGPDDRLWTQGDRKFVISNKGWKCYQISEGDRKLGLIWRYNNGWRYSSEQNRNQSWEAETDTKAFAGLVALSDGFSAIDGLREYMRMAYSNGRWTITNE